MIRKLGVRLNNGRKKSYFFLIYCATIDCIMMKKIEKLSEFMKKKRGSNIVVMSITT